MIWTLSVVQIPASNQTVLLVAICQNPSMFGGGGSKHLQVNLIPYTISKM